VSSATVHPDARGALRTRLAATAGLPAERAFEGYSYTPKPGTPFIEDKLVVVDDIPRAVGAIEHRMSYIVTLKYPSDEGTADIEAMAGALLDQFKVGTKLTNGSTSVLCQAAARRGSIQEDAGWAVLTVQVQVWTCTLE
jgi:hypothetical protein